MERHDLHQSARADRAACVRIERRIFSEQNTDQQCGVDLLLVSLIDERVGNAEGERAVVRVLVQDFTDAEGLLGRLRSIDDRGRQSQQPARVRVEGVLLRNRPHGSAHEQPAQCQGMGGSTHGSLHWRRQPRRRRFQWLQSRFLHRFSSN